MNKKLKLCTVVVTYNRSKLLLRNLESQFNQNINIDYVVIVDNNSTDGTEEILIQNKIIGKENVSYHKLKENIGGAGGFEYGLRKAYELGADVICLMDDDGYALNEYTFESVMDYIDNSVEIEKPFFINSMVVCNDENITFPYEGVIKTRKEAVDLSVEGFLEGYGSPFNATFVNRQLIDKIGFPRGDFFIRYDEVDYFFKAKSINAHVGVVTDSLYFHPETSKYEEKFVLGKLFINDYEKGWKEYYKTRNSIILYRELEESGLRLLKNSIKRIVGLYVFGVSNKMEITKYIIKGTFDAFRNKTGKVVNPY